MKNQANAWTAKDCPLFDKCRYADDCPWKTTDGRIVCASGMYEIPGNAPQTDPDVELLYPVDVSMPDGSMMTIADRETHLKALRAWGCHSELFTAATREEAERIASAELAEIAAQTDRGIELTRSWVRFFPSMNHRGGRQMQGFFYATREAAGIGGNFPNGGTRTLRERLTEALLNAKFWRAEIDTMLNDPKCCEEAIYVHERRMKPRPMPVGADKKPRNTTPPDKKNAQKTFMRLFHKNYKGDQSFQARFNAFRDAARNPPDELEKHAWACKNVKMSDFKRLWGNESKRLNRLKKAHTSRR